jgi:outer membrane protein TolC
LKNSYTNQVYANEKRAADARAKEALAAYLPTVTLTGALDDNVKVQETVIPAGIFGPDDIRVAFTKQYQINPMAQLDQTIFDKSLITGLQANRYNKLQAELDIAKNEETLIYNICKAYFQIAVYREQLKQLQATSETYRGQLQVTEQQVNRGVTLLKDLEKIKVNYNASLAQIRVAETNLTLSENQLKYEMGFPIGEQLAVKAISSEPGDFYMPGIDSLQDTSVGNRTEVKLLHVNTKLNEIDQRRLRSIIYPKLTAYARYGSIGFGDELSEAWSSMASYGTIGLKVSIPIVDFKRQAQVTQSKYKWLNSMENVKLEESRYQVELENAETKFRQEQSNVLLYAENIKLAQSTFAVIHLQYQKGTTDLTEWLTAQNTLKESHSNYLNSLYTFFQARVDLERAQGTLKSFYQAL